MPKVLFLLLMGLLFAPSSIILSQTKARQRQPIVDVHLHGYPPDRFSKLPGNPVTGKPLSIATGEEHMKATLAAMKRYNIVKGVVSAPLGDLSQWYNTDPKHIILSPYFEGHTSSPLPDIKVLRSEYEANRLGAMGEIGAQYAGLSLADPKFEPYLALAEQQGVPVGIHTGLVFREYLTILVVSTFVPNSETLSLLRKCLIAIRNYGSI